MDEKGYSWTRLDGSMNSCQRNEVIAHFQDNSLDSPQVLLLSLRAGMSSTRIQILSNADSNNVMNIHYSLLYSCFYTHLCFVGGVGLNLTAARKLILLDPAWNPATEEQCFDRIHRLGQTQDVEIIRLIMKDR